jgi:hypothetical protein
MTEYAITFDHRDKPTCSGYPSVPEAFADARQRRLDNQDFFHKPCVVWEKTRGGEWMLKWSVFPKEHARQKWRTIKLFMETPAMPNWQMIYELCVELDDYRRHGEIDERVEREMLAAGL